MKTLLLALLGVTIACASGGAPAMERSSLVALGLSADQLERIKTELVRRTRAQELPGAVFLVDADGAALRNGGGGTGHRQRKQQGVSQGFEG
jgi:hypothetical protein